MSGSASEPDLKVKFEALCKSMNGNSIILESINIFVA